MSASAMQGGYNDVAYISKDFVFYHTSAMEKIQNNILFGRPFVGTAVLVHKKFAAYCNRMIKAEFHYAIWFEAGSKLVADRFEACS